MDQRRERDNRAGAPAYRRLLGLSVACLIASTASGAAAQAGAEVPLRPGAADTFTVVPGADYRAGRLQRTLLGGGWRDVWLTPVDAPVFDFDRLAGGVRWTRRGGGNQSITLHLEAAPGWREYIFRSVDKFPEQALPPELRGTTVGWMVTDLVSAMFPAAPLLVPPFMEAVGVLHVDPVLRVMPDDPRLEVYQDTFAGMLGTVEIQPNEAPGDRPGYAGSSKIKGTEEFFNDLEASKAHRLDEREFLAARLVDFLINDVDRTTDNVRWARFGVEGDYRWRPIPIDRDWAFLDARGPAAALARSFYGKVVAFGPEAPPLTALVYSTHQLDRRLLQRLERSDFEEVAAIVSDAITDEVIENGVARLPPRWGTETRAPARIRAALRARRDALPELALEFYHWLATDVDIRGTDEPDRALIERLDDGRVRVTITWPAGHDRAGEPFYQRTFLPSETGEVRVFLGAGEDEAVVSGRGSTAIAVRVIGGSGGDHLVDEAGGGATRFYDADGRNRIERTARTGLSHRPWTPPEPNEGVRLGTQWVPDWGGSRGWSPALDYGDVAGVIVGLGPRWTAYGFRRLPYHWDLRTHLLYATGAGGFGGDIALDYRLENSPLALTLDGRAVTFDALRFDGLGNRTAHAGPDALVERDFVRVQAGLAWHIGWRDRRAPTTFDQTGEDTTAGGLRPLEGRLDLGPVLLWTDARPEPGSPFALAVPPDRRSFARAGLRGALQLDRTDRDAVPRRGWRLALRGAGYPEAGDVVTGFGEAGGQASAYLPILQQGTHLAVRLGGSVVSAGAPLQHSAWLGGRTTLRGYRWQRYRGDAAAFGSLELRVPVTRLELLARWDLGVFGLADAGRVWLNGSSPGGWHTGLGGGLWLKALGWAFSGAYAYGEEHRLYLQTGLSF